ncbi:hypothetical protein RQN30_12175 [Arcanobacterium hippocoleae]
MKRYLKPMMWLNTCFSLIVAVFSFFALFKLGNQPALVVFSSIAVIAFIVLIYGMMKERPAIVAAGALAISLLMPTEFGIFPMIIGFIFFVILLSLQLYLILFAENSRGEK